MAVPMVSSDLTRIALDRVDGGTFERFVNDFYPAISGASIVPLGGNKDGGADGFHGKLFESAGTDTFYQASIEQDAEAKIRGTVGRLRSFGRKPKRLIYVTARVVRYSDKVESSLSEELDVAVTIRDGNYIASHINDGPQTRAAFNQHLRHLTDFLKNVAPSNLIAPSRHVKSPAVYVFLTQEMERRGGNQGLVDAMTDSLALWALEGTDPDKGILRSSGAALERINSEVPSVQSLVEPRLQARLEALSSKSYPGGRAVRWHKHENKFCLPYETRARLAEENEADELLRLRMRESLAERLEAGRLEGLGEASMAEALEVATRSLQLAFEREGLEFASFLHDTSGNGDFPTIVDAIKEAVRERGIGGRRAELIGSVVFGALNGVFYNSNEIERRYLQKLSKTYALLFTLNTEPRLLEFFQEMAGDFYLYVGADVLVRALSEHFLAAGDQMTANTLRIATRHGANLILASPVLEEVVGHLRACDVEYKRHIAGRDEHLPYEVIRDEPHIMLRAYLYAKINQSLGRRRPLSWQGFINQFCDYADLHKPSALEGMRRYLGVAFGVDHRSHDELTKLVDPSEVDSLTEALAADKKDERLARNDALIALAVYGRRSRRRESASLSEFGYQTWWLTSETSIMKHTRALVAGHGARYIMRPDFLLNFLSLAPSAADARRTFENVFPSLLGIKLARRMDPQSFHRVMERVQEAEDLNEARRTAAIAKIVDQLKGDFAKQFLFDTEEASIDMAARRAASE